ncbi:hypothetical protein [Nocardia gipuzkoensis]|uniref:hypothetical protein n=1 Tax=Nocardia gipuzkoensis TaxID=2749991 RepID=UPI003EE1BF33
MIAAFVTGVILAAVAALVRRASLSRGFTLAAVVCLTIPAALSLIRLLPCLDVPVAAAASAAGITLILWTRLPYPATRGVVAGFFATGIGLVVAALFVASVPSASSYIGSTLYSNFRYYCTSDPILRCEVHLAHHVLQLLAVAIITGLSLVAAGVFVWGSLRHTHGQSGTHSKHQSSNYSPNTAFRGVPNR